MNPEQTIRGVEPGVRDYQPKDAPAILSMLKAEGINEDETAFAKGVTRVLFSGDEIIGFFVLGIDHNLPYLRLFCIARNHRSNHSNAFALIKVARRIALNNGYGQMIVHARGRRTIRIVRAYFRAMPYDQADNGTCFFKVGT